MGGRKWEKNIKTKARDFVFKNKFVHVQTHAHMCTKDLRGREQNQFLNFGYFQWRRETNVSVKKKKQNQTKNQKNPEPTLNVLPKELKKHKPNQGNRSLRNNLLCPHELYLSAAKESFIFSLIEANVREV